MFFLPFIFVSTALCMQMEDASNTYLCKFERWCQPDSEHSNSDCMDYSNVTQCSQWTVHSFVYLSSKLEIIQLRDIAMMETYSFAISQPSAMYIPPMFYPTRNTVMLIYYFLSTEISAVYLADALDASFSSLYSVKVDRMSNIVTIHKLSARGGLYAVVIPRVPTTVYFAFYDSVMPPDLPSLPDSWAQRVGKLFYSSSLSLYWAPYVLILALLLCCSIDVIRKSDTTLTISPDAKLVIRQLIPHKRVCQVNNSAYYQLMEPLPLISNQTPDLIEPSNTV